MGGCMNNLGQWNGLKYAIEFTEIWGILLKKNYIKISNYHETGKKMGR